MRLPIGTQFLYLIGEILPRPVYTVTDDDGKLYTVKYDLDFGPFAGGIQYTMFKFFSLENLDHVCRLPELEKNPCFRMDHTCMDFAVYDSGWSRYEYCTGCNKKKSAA